jgi:pilus assembly protein CpaC
MHTTFSYLKLLTGGGLLTLLTFGLSQPLWAQANADAAQAMIVPIGGTKQLQMDSKKAITDVFVPKSDIVSVRTVVGDPTMILLTGQQPGSVRLELTDADGKKEAYQVVVQLDVEYLSTQLQRAVPTANIVPIPVSATTVILSGTVARAEDAEIVRRVAASIGGIQIIDGLRIAGVQQVQLDVVVAQVARSDFRRMAFDFLTASEHFFFASTVSGALATPPGVGVGGAFASTAIPGGPNGAAPNLLFGVLHNGWGFVGFLQALRDENLVKLMASPRLVTLSGRPASFLVGGEQAIPVPAGLGQVGVQFEEFGTRLNFLPIVLGNGKIHLEVEPEVSTLDAANGTAINGTIVPGRVTNRVNTTVQMEAGQTLVIGGLIQHQVLGSTTKTPILGDLPFIGTAFSRKSFQEVEQEMIILVTPHFVDGQDCSQVTRVLPGEETRTPDDFELFLEGILEAPRGPREVFQDKHYVPAWMNGPSAGMFPCADYGKKGCWGGRGQCDSNVSGYTKSASSCEVGMPATFPSKAPAAPAPSHQHLPAGPSGELLAPPTGPKVSGPGTTRLPESLPVRTTPLAEKGSIVPTTLPPAPYQSPLQGTSGYETSPAPLDFPDDLLPSSGESDGRE